MSSSETKANILVVDDRPDSLMALESALADLDQNVITAISGPEALRHVLKMEFAVILLDVHMPGMDGFETAELIRKRMSSRQTPIIFITGYTDELHISKGYSLGAVDYILSPVVPEVLRAKVGVFVDLFKKNRQIAAQAESLQRHASQLQELNQASIAIHSATSIEEMLPLVADTGRRLLEAAHARIRVKADQYMSHELTAESRSPEPSVEPVDPGTRSELPEWNDPADRHPDVSEGPCESTPELETTQAAPWQPARLGIRLVGGDSREIGLVEVTDLPERRFTRDDEAVLIQLARIGSIAIENMLSAKAREANRLKDEFLATLSHELRTPLNAMLGWIRLLSDEEIDEAMLQQGLQVIERNVNAQSKLIEDLLDISRITSGKLRLDKQSMCLKSVVEAAIDTIKPTADAKQITLESELPASSVSVWGDPDRLQQAVSNLLSNAVKFTPDGGWIWVGLESGDREAGIRIRDTGEGIDPELLPHIFDRFRQADTTSTRKHSGLGVGLAIVRHIIEMHGGKVRAESAGKGEGTTFCVHLPLPEPRPDTSPQAVAGVADQDLPGRDFSGRQALEGLRILVVDDELDARELLYYILSHQQAEVGLAGSVEEALEIVKQWAPDILLSDIAMPGRDGYALIRTLRTSNESRLREIPAVALTAYAGEQDVARAADAGFEAHIAKPVEPDALVRVLARTMRGELQAADGGSLRQDDRSQPNLINRLDTSR